MWSMVMSSSSLIHLNQCHINCLLQGTDRACIMTAIEESVLNERQTELMIQDNIGKNNILIISVGGNDIV